MMQLDLIYSCEDKNKFISSGLFHMYLILGNAIHKFWGRTLELVYNNFPKHSLYMLILIDLMSAKEKSGKWFIRQKIVRML